MVGTTREQTLDQLALGAHGRVLRIGGAKEVRRRLLAMGLVTGTTVTLTAIAPLGDPLELTVRGYHLSLRKDEARQIIVEVTDAAAC